MTCKSSQVPSGNSSAGKNVCYAECKKNQFIEMG